MEELVEKFNEFVEDLKESLSDEPASTDEDDEDDAE